jgi:cysteine-S-conjugate beta-lyase
MPSRIRDRLRRRSEKWRLYPPDVLPAFSAEMDLATEPGDSVVINPPVYPPFFQHVGFDRRRVVEVPPSGLSGPGRSSRPGGR